MSIYRLLANYKNGYFPNVNFKIATWTPKYIIQGKGKKP